jgi:8-oxo-dGTP pyrophosphatase MutT (NUDIX family)
MHIERSAGTIIFIKKEGKTYYLLLHYPKGARTESPYWDFPKGHLEKGESPEEAAKREALEETGLADLEFVSGFKEVIKYFFQIKGDLILKFVVFYLCQTKKEEIMISDEHCGYQWLPYEEALKELKFDNAKRSLKKAKDFLQRKNI